MCENLFKGIDNFRDLGGMFGAEGKRIKSGLLYRSAQLSCPYDEDKQGIDALSLKTIVDFRTAAEAKAQPDYIPEGCVYLSLPPLEGFAGEGLSYFLMKLRFLSSPSLFFGNLYKKLAVGDMAKKAYKAFFGILLENQTPVVWHCNQGKDRTGIATMLLLHCLGVDVDIIFRDYMLTNEYMQRLHAEKSKGSRLGAKIYGELLFVKKKNYDRFLARVAKKYGDLDGYLAQIGIGDKEKEILKGLYLE